ADVGARVLARGRRVHRDARGAAREDAEIAAEARVGGRRLDALDVAVERLAQPRVERAKTVVHRGSGYVYPSAFDSSIRSPGSVGPRSIRTACIALACALHAEAVPAQDEGLRLKVERQLHMAVPKPERDSAKFIEADHIEGEQDRNIVATGNVTLRQRGA